MKFAAGYVAGMAVAAAVACGSNPPISDKGQRELANHAIVLEACRQEGRAAKSLEVFDACVARAEGDGGR